MKFLIPIDDAVESAIAPIEQVKSAKRKGMPVEVLLLNVQRPFSYRVSRLSSKTGRDALHAQRGAEALTGAIERLTRTGVPFRAIMQVGDPAECIAATAEAEQVDEILMSVARRPRWLYWRWPSGVRDIISRTDIPVSVVARGTENSLDNYLVPAGIAGVAAIAALIIGTA
jgi:nucleotide-binding universal stress UspA family protein